MTMDWYVFEHGVRVLAWNRATGETQVGAPPLWGGESIGSEEKVLARPQFKFGATPALRAQAEEKTTSMASDDSDYGNLPPPPWVLEVEVDPPAAAPFLPPPDPKDVVPRYEMSIVSQPGAYTLKSRRNSGFKFSEGLREYKALCDRLLPGLRTGSHLARLIASPDAHSISLREHTSVIGGATVLKHAGGATFAESDLRDLLEREQACGTQTTLTLTLCSRGRRRVIPCACVGLAWAHA